LGSDDFIQQVKNQTIAKTDSEETPLEHRQAGRPELAELLMQKTVQTRAQRNKLIYKAHVIHGYKLKQIADVLGIHYTTVSKIVNNKVR